MASPAGRAHLFSRKPIPSGIELLQGNKLPEHRFSRGPFSPWSPPEKTTPDAVLTRALASKTKEATDGLTPEKREQLNLPIYQIREKLLRAVDLSDVVVITAETGAGKSTQVPQMLLDQGYTVTMTQPRRLAASSVALRIAKERGGAR